MKPSEARLLLVDDFPLSERQVRKNIEGMGGVLVAVASTPEEATSAVDDITSNGVNVVLMDCNLTKNPGNEGYGLTQRIRDEHPEVHVVSISSNPIMGEELGIPTLASSGMSSEELQQAIELL